MINNKKRMVKRANFAWQNHSCMLFFARAFTTSTEKKYYFGSRAIDITKI